MSVDILERPDHPDAMLYPLDEENIENLAAQIASAERVRVPFLVADGMVADGRRRKRALQLLLDRDKVRYPYEVVYHDPKKEGSLFLRIVHINSGRRDRPRGLEAHPLIDRFFGDQPTATDAMIAEQLHVSRETVRNRRRDLIAAGKLLADSTRVNAKGVERPTYGRVLAPRGEEAAINHEDETEPAAPPTSTGPPRGEAVKPPPDAGDAWEPPPTGSPEEAALKGQHEDAAAAEKMPRDFLGQKLPKHLADTFADEFYREMSDTMLYFARRIKNHPDLYVRLLTNPPDGVMGDEVEDCAQRWSTLLAYHRPYRVCPHCCGAGCKPCLGTGWFSKGQHDEHEAYVAAQPQTIPAETPAS